MKLDCDILLLEGAFKERGFRKAGVEVSELIEYYAKKAKCIVTVGTCATFGGVFKEADPDNISGMVSLHIKVVHEMSILNGK